MSNMDAQSKNSNSNNSNSNNSSPKTLADPIFRQEFKKFNSKTKTKPNKSKDWSHKEQCLLHDIGPLLIDNFGQNIEKCINLCSCQSTKEKINKQYTKITKISLLDALSSYTKTFKEAKLGILHPPNNKANLFPQ